MSQENESKSAERHMTRAMFRSERSESLRGGSLMTLICLEMSQNSCCLRLLPLPSSESVLLKQTPPPPVDVVVPVLRVELAQRAIVQQPCLVFQFWRLCLWKHRQILYGAERPLQLHMPHHPS